MKKQHILWKLVLNSDGNRNHSKGKWNETKQTLSFQNELEGARSMHTTVQFPSPNQEVWHLKVTDGSGKVYFDMGNTVTRRNTE